MPNQNSERMAFASDYMEGCHPAILQRLTETNLEKSAGYGTDAYSEAAREKIRAACEAPEAEVFFLAGGTQTNATVIDAMLRSYQGVIAAVSGHVAVHEAGAIEFGGHKVLTLEQTDGKISAEDIRACIDGYRLDDNHEHMVMPGMVYLSQPTEYGTLYSLRELEAISTVCREAGVSLYVDGARLAYALACPENDVSLPDLARLCDAFYIGGTKCGALFGEAVVFPKRGTVPHFFTIVKQHGALLAKGRIAGIQFETLFTDGLYDRIGERAIITAARIRAALQEKGYRLTIPSPTNQIFITMTNAEAEQLGEKVEMSFMEQMDADHAMMRICTSWATSDQDVDRLISCL
ncbi:MAG: aminotransferase class V-fold PLP-dependent enzyme [Clostridia bacterium]|nr:aminotransferase class V-fold PLP-dependent enzyme [Clostridia bacterium]MBR0386160.1 aminotransferase class V-fold PLP-dependent enzyme [Clostridia bacterium]